jgi:subtilase family serine protease
MLADPNTGMLYGETYAISGDTLVDAGCTKLSVQLEYCERRIGGTSLASPLFAGVLALADQARATKVLGPVGFVNPALYTTARRVTWTSRHPQEPLRCCAMSRLTPTRC